MYYRPDCFTGINSERRPSGRCRSNVILGGLGSRTLAGGPTCWPRAVNQLNRARCVGSESRLKQATSDAHT